MAESDHVSVDRLVAALVNESVADWSRVQARAERGSLEKLKHVLSKAAMLPRTLRIDYRSRRVLRLHQGQKMIRVRYAYDNSGKAAL